jgi:hypothetical protein
MEREWIDGRKAETSSRDLELVKLYVKEVVALCVLLFARPQLPEIELELAPLKNVTVGTA